MSAAFSRGSFRFSQRVMSWFQSGGGDARWLVKGLLRPGWWPLVSMALGSGCAVRVFRRIFNDCCGNSPESRKFTFYHADMANLV